MDRGAWQATVHRVILSQTQLKQMSMHACIPCSLAFFFFQVDRERISEFKFEVGELLT